MGGGVSSRLHFPRSELRARTVRGAVVTAAFLVAIDGLVLGQGLIVTRLLGPSEIGLYGIVSTTVVTVLALKRVGIDEAFVAHETDDLEREYQHAFTLELALAVIAALVLALLAPILAAAYGEPQLLGLTLGVAWLPLAFALLAPLWIFFRRMDYVRQRSLQSLQPLVTFAVTVPLADDDRPHAEGGRRGQRHRDREGHERLQGLQGALADVVHAPEEDP